jgi:hypothetical protein
MPIGPCGDGVEATLTDEAEPLGPGLLPEVESDHIIAYRAGYSLRKLSKELVDQHVKATMALFWNADEQQWVRERLPMSDPVITNPYERPCFYDRIIRADEGFFLLTGENGLYIPELPLLVPPKPPLVRYSGVVQKLTARIYEGTPPYNYFMMVPCGPMLPAEKELPLKGVDYNREKQLAIANQAGGTALVAGTMKTITYGALLPPYQRTVEVLMVESCVLIKD